MKKKIGIILVVFLIFMMSDLVVCEGFLPSLNKELGIDVPLVSKILDKQPKAEYVTEDRTNYEEYDNISFDDYIKIGRCFGKSGFALMMETFDNGTIRLLTEKEKKAVVFEYDLVENVLKIWYPRYFSDDYSSYTVSKEESCLFPTIEEMAGVILPRLSTVLKQEPSTTKRIDSGVLQETYCDFSEEDYESVSKYLQDQGCSVLDYRTEDGTLIIYMEKKGKEFTFKYDPSKNNATVEYAEMSYVEPITTNTPVPTATPKPTVSSDNYNQYAAIFVSILRSMQNKPDSMEIHGIRVMEYQNDTFIVIDFSTMNVFGGYDRNIYSFKFEYGHISLTGNSSDYDMYENHKNEFQLISSLNVNSVMKLLNK